MKKYNYIFFDLDGTVVDSGEGIKKSASYALKQYGINAVDEDSLNAFIGPPLKNSFMDIYGMNAEDAVKCISFYREYYLEKGIFQGYVYSGMRELLSEITSNSIKAVLATSKPEVYAEMILKHFKIDEYFTLISGATFDEKLVEKHDIILNTADRLGISDMSGVLMVGDRKFDIEGGKLAGTDTAGVLYGYGSYKELYAAGADFIVSGSKDIINLLSL